MIVFKAGNYLLLITGKTITVVNIDVLDIGVLDIGVQNVGYLFDSFYHAYVCHTLSLHLVTLSHVTLILSPLLFLSLFNPAIVEDQRRRLSLVLPVVVLMELYIISLLPIRRY